MLPCKGNLEVLPLVIENGAIELQSIIHELGFSTKFVVGQEFRQKFALPWFSIDTPGAIALRKGSVKHDIVRRIPRQVDAIDRLALFDVLVHIQARLDGALPLIVLLPVEVRSPTSVTFDEVATALAGAAPDVVVPNSEFVATRLTNWTLGERILRVPSRLRELFKSTYWHECQRPTEKLNTYQSRNILA